MKEHTCSYYCERPECIRAQRDELRDRLERELAAANAEYERMVAAKDADNTALLSKFIDAKAEAEALREDAERLQFLDDANTSLADENCRMRLALMELIDAIDGCEDLDEMDGLEFNLSQERLEKAMATARPFHENELLKVCPIDAQAAAALGGGK